MRVGDFGVCSSCCEGVEGLRRCRSACSRSRAAGEASDRTRTRPSGDFPVEVVKACVPGEAEAREELGARRDRAQRRPGDDPEHRPDRQRLRRAQASSPDLADPNRPVFAINGVQVKIAGFPESKDAAPRGCDTAYVNTWACGPLKPNEMKTFRWSVTAVRAGDYKVTWRVNAGLDGKAKAVAQGGGPAPTRHLRRARSRTRRRRCAWPTTATRSSTGLAEPLLVARAALHRYPRVLGEAVVGPVPEAHGEHASARRFARSSGACSCRRGPLSRR